MGNGGGGSSGSGGSDARLYTVVTDMLFAINGLEETPLRKNLISRNAEALHLRRKSL